MWERQVVSNPAPLALLIFCGMERRANGECLRFIHHRARMCRVWKKNRFLLVRAAASHQKHRASAGLQHTHSECCLSGLSAVVGLSVCRLRAVCGGFPYLARTSDAVRDTFGQNYRTSTALAAPPLLAPSRVSRTSHHRRLNPRSVS